MNKANATKEDTKIISPGQTEGNQSGRIDEPKFKPGDSAWFRGHIADLKGNCFMRVIIIEQDDSREGYYWSSTPGSPRNTACSHEDNLLTYEEAISLFNEQVEKLRDGFAAVAPGVKSERD